MLLIGQERGKGQIGKIPGPSPSKSGKSRKKSGKSQKRTKKEGQVQIGKPPRLKPPRLAALDFFRECCGSPSCCFSYIKGQKHPLKTHIANVLGGYRLDEQSDGRLERANGSIFAWSPAHPLPFQRFDRQGFSNVPWRKRAFGPGTKYVFLDLFLGILLALCTGKGALLVRHLCTT